MAACKQNREYNWIILVGKRIVLRFTTSVDNIVKRFDEAMDVWPNQEFKLYCGNKLVSEIKAK